MREPFAIQFGTPTTTTVPGIVMSLNPGDAVVTCNGQSQTVPMTAQGTDRGSGKAQAGYFGNFTLTGLAKLTRYPVTVTQGGNTISDASCMTAPQAGDDYSLFFCGCDNNSVFGGRPAGIYGYIKDYALGRIAPALPLVGIDFHDDDGYASNNAVNDMAATGHSVTGSPYITFKVYDYLLGWLAGYGLFEDLTNKYIAWGRNASRIWCTRNVNKMPQWGDWEFANDIGWDQVAGVNTPALSHLAYAPGKAAWDITRRHLQGPSIGIADTVANHWAVSFGDLKIIKPDGVTRGSGNYVTSEPPTSPITVFGADQITDILNAAANGDHAFIMLDMMHSIRYLVGTGRTEFMSGAQHPLFDHALAEYQRLFTESGHAGTTGDPKSLMDLIAGGTKQFFCAHGDEHSAKVLRNAAAAYAGNLAESFISVVNGTSNGSTNFGCPAAVVEGYTFGGSTVLYKQDNGDPTSGYHRFHGMRVDIYGSRSPKEMHVTLLHASGRPVWRGVWKQGENGNLPVLAAGVKMAA